MNKQGWNEIQFYQSIICKINEIQKRKERVIISIDGMCGSGKTHLANLIQKVFSARVFHMDDYYLPIEERDENWESICGGNIDYGRFIYEVMEPAISGKIIHYQPYSCQKKRLLDSIVMKDNRISIVEGSYSQHPCLNGFYDLKVFMTCTERIQRERLIQREGNHFAMFEQRWIPLEWNYFNQYNVKDNSDISIDTSFLGQENRDEEIK